MLSGVRSFPLRKYRVAADREQYPSSYLYEFKILTRDEIINAHSSGEIDDIELNDYLEYCSNFAFRTNIKVLEYMIKNNVFLYQGVQSAHSWYGLTFRAMYNLVTNHNMQFGNVTTLRAKTPEDKQYKAKLEALGYRFTKNPKILRGTSKKDCVAFINYITFAFV